jgi:aminoglycoside phosphotransferase (APT) family kinase protein
VSGEPLVSLCALLGGEGARVLDRRRLTGGLHTSTELVTARNCSGGAFRFVLRRYPRGPAEPSLCRREALSLAALEASDIPVPRHLWGDPEGRLFGVPANAISFMFGSLPRTPRPSDYRDLARVIARLHAEQPLLELPRLDRSPPPVGNGLCYRRVVQYWPAFRNEQERFLHGDVCLANTLFEGNSISALLDWSHAAVGPASVDVAAMWVDAALFGPPGAADVVIAAYRDAAGAVPPGLEAIAALYLLRSRDRLHAWIQAARAHGADVDDREVLGRYRALVASERNRVTAETASIARRSAPRHTRASPDLREERRP